jgi:hypothetical protein
LRFTAANQQVLKRTPLAERFLEEYGEQIQEVLSGFDRLIFRGTLQPVCYLHGLHRFLRAQLRLLQIGVVP